VVSLRHKRWDILLYTPTYLVLRFVDSYLFLKGFHQAFFGPKSEKLTWQSSTRYKLS